MFVEERLTYQQWKRDAPALRVKSAPLVAAFVEIRRDKPRDPTEAAFLREIGTPERLVGPVPSI